jgi:FdhD protein
MTMFETFEVERYPSHIQEMDPVTIEEPLEIRIRAGTILQRIAVTMRTPGHDLELALGFLFGEGVIRSRSEVLGQRSSRANEIEIELDPTSKLDLKRFERNFYVSSSCGVCGKSSLEAVWEQTRYCDQTGPGTGPFIQAELISSLPGLLREKQLAFSKTGSLHGSGLFSTEGKLLSAMEDVGRHNALDKIIGSAWMSEQLPLDQTLLLLSGRVSFELMQKAAMAGIRIIAAVGAPSSLAVSLAKEFDLTLIGFVREKRFNIYHGSWRLRGITRGQPENP